MSNEKINVNDDTWLVILHARVLGVVSESEVIRNERQGEQHERERKVTTIIENETEHENSVALVAKLRQTLYKYSTATPLGQLTDGTRKTELLAQLDAARAEVDAHNEALTSGHTVEFDVIPLPIGLSLGPKTQRLLCESVVGALGEVRKALVAGDFKKVRAWSQRNKNLDALMPPVIAEIVRQATCEGLEMATKLRRLIVDANFTPEAAGATLNLEIFDTAIGMIGVAPVAQEATVAA